MAVAFRSTNGVLLTAFTATASPTITKPTGASNGDLMLMFVVTATTTDMADTCAGWTQVPSEVATGSNDATVGLYWKIASGEGASWTMTNLFNSSEDGAAVVICYTGVHQTTPIHQSSSAQGSSGPSLTTTKTGCMIVQFNGCDPGTGTYSGTPNASPAGNERHDAKDGGNNAYIYIQDYLQSVAGEVTLTPTVTSDNYGCYEVALLDAVHVTVEALAMGTTSANFPEPTVAAGASALVAPDNAAGATGELVDAVGAISFDLFPPEATTSEASWPEATASVGAAPAIVTQDFVAEATGTLPEPEARGVVAALVEAAAAGASGLAQAAVLTVAALVGGAVAGAAGEFPEPAAMGVVTAQVVQEGIASASASLPIQAIFWSTTAQAQPARAVATGPTNVLASNTGSEITSWGMGSTRTEAAQSFLGDGKRLAKASFGIWRTQQTSIGTLSAKLYAHSGTFGDGTPTGEALATSYGMSPNGIPGAGYYWVEFLFPESYLLEDGTPYFISFCVTYDVSYLNIVLDGASTGNAAEYYEGTWIKSSGDLQFSVSTERAPDIGAGATVQVGTATANGAFSDSEILLSQVVGAVPARGWAGLPSSLFVDLMAYYGFDSLANPGDDYHSTGRDLTESPSVSHPSGKTGYGIATGGGYLYRTTQDFRQGGDFTIAFWMKYQDGNDASVISVDGGALPDYYIDQVGGPLVLRFFVTGVTSATIEKSEGSSWEFFVARYDANARRVSISKNAGAWTNSTGPPSSSVQQTSTRIKVGSESLTDPIDEVQVYSRKLTDEEVAQLYNSDAGFFWPFAVHLVLHGNTIEGASGEAAASFPEATASAGIVVAQESTAAATAEFPVHEAVGGGAALVEPSGADASGSWPDPEVLSGAGIAGEAATATGSWPGPDLYYGAGIVGEEQEAAGSWPAPEVSYGATVAGEAATGTAEWPTPEALYGALVGGEAAGATAEFLEASAAVGLVGVPFEATAELIDTIGGISEELFPPGMGATAQFPEATAWAPAVATPSAMAATAEMLVPTWVGVSTVYPDPFAATAEIVDSGAHLSPTVGQDAEAGAAGALLQPEVTGAGGAATVIVENAAGATAELLEAGAFSGVLISGEAGTGQAEWPVPEVSGVVEAQVGGEVAAAQASFPVPEVAAGVGALVEGEAGAATASLLDPGISVKGTVGASEMVATAGFPEPGIQVSQTVAGVEAEAAASWLVPTVGTGGSISGEAGTAAGSWPVPTLAVAPLVAGETWPATAEFPEAGVTGGVAVGVVGAPFAATASWPQAGVSTRRTVEAPAAGASGSWPTPELTLAPTVGGVTGEASASWPEAGAQAFAGVKLEAPFEGDGSWPEPQVTVTGSPLWEATGTFGIPEVGVDQWRYIPRATAVGSWFEPIVGVPLYPEAMVATASWPTATVRSLTGTEKVYLFAG